MGANSYDLLVGCYGTAGTKNIHVVRFHGETASLEKLASYQGVDNPSYLAVDADTQHVYAISEVEQGNVSCYKLDSTLNGLQYRNSLPTKGAPCYVELGYGNQFLFIANYGNGSVIVHKLEQDGDLEKEISYIKPFNKEKKRRSQIHMIRRLKGSHFYMATDIGLDTLYVYTFDEQKEKLELYKEFQLPPGSGPRHLEVHPTHNMLYIVNEYQSTVLTYHYNDMLTQLTLKQVLPTIPVDFKGDNYGADIQLTPSGNHLYVSNRGHHSITGYRVMENGCLQLIEQHTTQGQWPRQFIILPDGKHLLAANEHTDNITVMEIKSDGRLVAKEASFPIEKPVCIQVYI